MFYIDIHFTINQNGLHKFVDMVDGQHPYIAMSQMHNKFREYRLYDERGDGNEIHRMFNISDVIRIEKPACMQFMNTLNSHSAYLNMTRDDIVRTKVEIQASMVELFMNTLNQRPLYIETHVTFEHDDKDVIPFDIWTQINEKININPYMHDVYISSRLKCNKLIVTYRTMLGNYIFNPHTNIERIIHEHSILQGLLAVALPKNIKLTKFRSEACIYDTNMEMDSVWISQKK